MAARAAIRDVGRTLDMSYPFCDGLSKLIPNKPGQHMTIALALEQEPLLAQRYEREDEVKILLNLAQNLEGLTRNVGMHAGGVLIAPGKLTDFCPLYQQSGSPASVSQFDKDDVEAIGLVKFDFLGLATLTILENAKDLILQKPDINANWYLDDIPLDDARTYKLFSDGKTEAVFQFESRGMQAMLKDAKPSRLEDLIVLNALFRPGPMALIPSFVARKHGREPVIYPHPLVEAVLAETYGIMVYQEQVMLLSQKIAGFTKGDADVLRKAMGKKQKSVLDKMKAQFVEGAVKNGHAEKALDKIWTDWEAFAQYAFNKSHSTCYAYVAYQTTYLKAHYPGEYMSAVLNHAGSIDKITFFMEECKRMGIKVLGPDINESLQGFSVNKNGEIRFGLGGLKGVGEAAIEAIIIERDKGGHFETMIDFIKRVLSKAVNKKSLESLAYSGTFDCFPEYHRAQYFNTGDGDRTNGMEKLIAYAQAIQSMTTGSTNTLFGDLPSAMQVPIPRLAQCEEWTLTEKLDHEKDITGMFMSGHPLDHFNFELKHYGFTPINEYNEVKDNLISFPNNLGKNFKLAGLVTEVQHRITKTGKNYGSFAIEDFTGKTDFILWSEDYVKFQNYLEVGQKVCINGSFRNRFNQPNVFEFKLQTMSLLETVKQLQTRTVELSLHPANLRADMIEFFEKNIKENPGRTSLKITFVEPREQLAASLLTIDKGFLVNDDFVQFLDLNPELNVQVKLAN
jgi:DNA polymerase-3 subunit alpha